MMIFLNHFNLKGFQDILEALLETDSSSKEKKIYSHTFPKEFKQHSGTLLQKYVSSGISIMFHWEQWGHLVQNQLFLSNATAETRIL